MIIEPEILPPTSTDGSDAVDPVSEPYVWLAIFIIALVFIAIVYGISLIISSLISPLLMLLGCFYLFRQATKKLGR